jgi:hypothetical protein
MEHSCGCDNGPWSSTVFWKTLEQLHNCQLLKKGAALLSKAYTREYRLLTFVNGRMAPWFRETAHKSKKKIKLSPNTPWRLIGLWDVKDRLIDGGKVVSPTHQPHFTPQKHYFFYVSGTHFCYGLSKPQGLVWPEGLGKFKISPHRISNPRPSGL